VIATRFKQMMRKHGVSGVRSNKAMCLDRCEHGPVIVIYPEGTWYRIEDVDVDVEEIVVSHLVGGEVVERLQLPAREDDPFAK
jgi:(2Fe-2S) ferredoxin